MLPQVLYLHANQIDKLNEVHKLVKLPNLQKLTLHGNPINELPHYRDHVAGYIPTLHNLDFSAITKLDRDSINVWIRGHQKRRSERD